MKSNNTNISEHYATLISQKLEVILSGIFGYHALLYSHYAKVLVKDNVNIKHSVVLFDDGVPFGESVGSNSIKPTNSLMCDFKALPISSDSIDLIVLPEILNQSEDPHQVLREAERVLIPEGHIVLVIANPFSWLSIKKRALGLLSSMLIQQKSKKRLLSRFRLSDWFRLLGLEITSEQPVTSWERLKSKSEARFNSENINAIDSLDARIKRWLHKSARWCSKIIIKQYARYCATYYIIVVKKRVSTITPIRESWRKNAKLVRPRLAEPSVSQQVERCLHQIKIIK